MKNQAFLVYRGSCFFQIATTEDLTLRTVLGAWHRTAKRTEIEASCHVVTISLVFLLGSYFICKAEPGQSQLCNKTQKSSL